jgi:DnaJ-domain-containing protein 1
MNGFLDRMAELLKSLIGEGSGTRSGSKFTDPDVSEAWEELDEYLKTGRNAQDNRGQRTRREGRETPRASRDEDLRQDYANLELPFGADLEEVKRAYKTLIMKYHPDKHAGNAEKLRMATEITKKINESFERIRSRIEGKRGTGTR